MLYLIAQYAILFLLTGFFGFMLGRWWARRSYVDVTESFESISRAAANAPWDRVWSRLDGMEQSVRGIVKEEIAALPQPEIPRVDLSGIHSQLAVLQQTVADLPTPPIINLDPLAKRIADVDARIASLPRPQAPERIDLSPLIRRMEALETAVRSIRIPEGPRLEPVHEHLQIIDGKLTQLVTRPASTTVIRTAGPELLESATFGAKDDLKKISGVGPTLEALLNQNGVYYFWQVADWSAADIKLIDDRLDVFPGRIERDNWVAQAKALATTASAARRPSAESSSAEEARP